MPIGMWLLYERVALAALGRDVPRFEGCAVIRRDKEIVPSGIP